MNGFTELKEEVEEMGKRIKGAYERQCQICGCEFITSTGKGKYCPNCRKQQRLLRMREDSKARYENQKLTVLLEKRQTKSVGKSISDINWELKEYNEKHNTDLSYGQYVLLLFLTELRGEENAKEKE